MNVNASPKFFVPVLFIVPKTAESRYRTFDDLGFETSLTLTNP